MLPASSALTETIAPAQTPPIPSSPGPSAFRAPRLYSVPAAAVDIAPPEFYAAARSGDTDAVFALLASGRFRASALEPATGRTALMLAAGQGHANVVALLTRGTLCAYIDTEDAEGHTALSLATAENHPAVVDLLRSRGAGWTALDAGPVPMDDDTVLPVPVQTYGPPSPAARTETAAPPAKTPAQARLSAIFHAIEQPNASALRALLLPDTDPVSTIGTLLAMTERRIVRGAETDDCTPLMAATFLGRAQMVVMLIHAGANVDQPNVHQMTALMMAAKNGHVKTVKALIRAHASVDLAGQDGWTALMLAAYYGHTAVFHALLAAHANVDRTTRNGASALIYAAMNGHAGIVWALLQAGANGRLVSMHGHTALSLAIAREHGEVIDLLRSDNAQAFRNWHIEKRAQ